LYALTSSNINRFNKIYLLILLPVSSGVITDVIGIWSVFCKIFIGREFCDYESGTITSDVVLFSIEDTWHFTR